MVKALYIHTQISNDHEPYRYSNIASDIELRSDIICYILCCRLFDVWLPGAPQLIVKSVEWHSLTPQN